MRQETRTVAGAHHAQAHNVAAVTGGRNIDPSTMFIPEELQEPARQNHQSSLFRPSNDTDTPFNKLRQSNYRWVPIRAIATDIRTASGPTMGPSPDGRAHIIGDSNGNVNHIRFGAGATLAQQALQVMSAGYAQTFASDAEAFDAARQSAIEAGEDRPRGMFERAAAGFMAYNGGHFKETAVAKQRFQKSLFRHAALGAEAYVSGRRGNAFTDYLNRRYGEMNADQQAWGVHILTDESSPESGWNPRLGPASESLVASGLPFSAANRAAASHSAVATQAAWGRGPAIRGLSAYAESLVAQKTSSHTHPMVRDALVAREALAVTAAEVSACQAIMIESPSVEEGVAACSSIGTVRAVASLATGGRANDYSSAYRSLRNVVRQIETTRAAQSSLLQYSPTVLPPTPEQVMFYEQSGTDNSATTFSSSSSSNSNSSSGIEQSAAQSELQQVQTRQARIETVTARPANYITTANASTSAPVMNFQRIFADPRNDLPIAQQLVMDMTSAGFSESQIQDPRVSQVALSLYQDDPSLLRTASVTARIMGDRELSRNNTQTVQQMIDAGWNTTNISRPDVYTAQMLVADGQVPSPQLVQQVRTVPQYYPRMSGGQPDPMTNPINAPRTQQPTQYTQVTPPPQVQLPGQPDPHLNTRDFGNFSR